MTTPTTTVPPVPKKEDSYRTPGKWKDLEIKTRDGTSLYYSKYNLASRSEYFEKLFSGDMADSREPLQMDYDTADVVLFLEAVDSRDSLSGLDDRDAITPQLVAMLNYYQFTDLVTEVCDILGYSSYGTVQWLEALYHDEFLEGSYAREFKALTEKILENLVANTSTDNGVALGQGLQDVTNVPLLRLLGLRLLTKWMELTDP